MSRISTHYAIIMRICYAGASSSYSVKAPSTLSQEIAKGCTLNGFLINCTTREG
ncbi:hypothetical protein SK128_001922, partial [Halocaridina rubra]